MERRTQLLCMLYESVTPSLLLALPLAPPPHHQSLLFFYGRKEGEAWQVSAVKARDKLCVSVSRPLLKRRKGPAWRLMSAQQEELRLLGGGSNFLGVLCSVAWNLNVSATHQHHPEYKYLLISHNISLPHTVCPETSRMEVSQPLQHNDCYLVNIH